MTDLDFENDSHPNMRYDQRGMGMLRCNCKCSYCEIKLPGMKCEDQKQYQHPTYRYGRYRLWCPEGCSRTAIGPDPINGKCPQCQSALK